MSTTILDALMNAQINYKTNQPFTRAIADEQLSNAIKLLEKGYDAFQLMDELIEQHGSVEAVPEVA